MFAVFAETLLKLRRKKNVLFALRQMKNTLNRREAKLEKVAGNGLTRF